MTRSEILQIAKPALFNTEMVLAILDDRKTEMRRVIKPQPWCDYPRDCGCSCWNYGKVSGSCPPHCIETPESPYKPDDYLYVRETWAPLYVNNENGIVGYMYRADDIMNFRNMYEPGIQFPNNKGCAWPGIWRPSIHMPKRVARIFLRVTNVRVERLHNITMSGMQAEGVIPRNTTGGQWQQWQNDYMKPVWESTVKAKERQKYGWEADPWVWVISFERITLE